MRLDFTSALYLGPRPLPPPPPGLALATGRPGALAEPPAHRRVARTLAHRQGLAAGALAPSTLHLFRDAVAMMPARAALLCANNLYPVGQWGSLWARARGLPVETFAPADLPALARRLHALAEQGRTPWVLAEGWHPGHGPAPLAAYLRLLRPTPEAVLLLDDTQALGVLGHRPTPAQPLGRGGGGSLRRAGLAAAATAQVLTICSLAKGYGVPVAVLAGSAARLAQWRATAPTRMHTSPVSGWHGWAAAAALAHDARHGEAARQRLARALADFRAAAAGAGLRAHGGDFAVQMLRLGRPGPAVALHQHLARHGIGALLLAGPAPGAAPDVAFCLCAGHRPADFARLGRCLRQFVAGAAAPSSTFSPAESHDYALV